MRATQRQRQQSEPKSFHGAPRIPLSTSFRPGAAAVPGVHWCEFLLNGKSMPRSSLDDTRPAWHALLGPLPPDVFPVRQPVASAELRASPLGSAVAGWQQLLVHLSAGAGGLRTVLVVLDGDGTLLSASDAVLYRNAPAAHSAAGVPATILQMSVGGRFEPDGSFHGTRWHSVALERGEEDPEWESTPSSPSEEDVEGLRGLVADVISRAKLKEA